MQRVKQICGGVEGMTYAQVKDFFQDKRDVTCDITNKLIENGFQQKTKGGYLEIADVSEIKNPSQWWHLMNYCLKKEEQHKENDNYGYTPCGELVFWMAEVSGAVEKEKLIGLAERIINSGEVDNRKKWNDEIKNLCWKKIKETIINTH